MPPPNTLGEAILRALGDFGQNVGGQMQANDLYNQQAQYKNLWDRLNFEATQDYRQEGLDLRRRGLDIAERGADLRQQEFDWNFLDTPAAQRIQRAVGVQPQFESEKDLDLWLRLNRPDDYYEHHRRKGEAGRAPAKAEKPFTAPQKTTALNQIVAKNVAGKVSEFPYAESIADITGAAKGTDKTPADTLAQRLLGEIEYLQSPEYRLAASRPDSLAKYFPERIAQPAAPQQQITDTTIDIPGPEARITPEIEQWGRSEYYDWDQLSPEQKFLTAKKHRKL